MKVSCNEGVASHVGPESCGDDRKVVVEALTGESAGRVLSLENAILWDADAVLSCGRQQRSFRQSEERIASHVVIDPAHAPKHFTRKPGDPRFGLGESAKSVP
jgi:hypothetical protein